MADEESVTIRAEMLDDVSGPADQIKKKVGEIGKAVDDVNRTSSGGLGTVGSKIDDIHTKGTTASQGGAAKLTKALKEANEQGAKVRETFAGIGETITEHLQYPLQQVSWALEGSIAGMVAFGAATEDSIQKGTLALSAFTGSSGMGSQFFTQLRALQGPVPFANLAAGFEQLSESGMGTGKLLPTLTALNNLAAVSLNPSSSLSAMAAAVSSITATKLISPSDVQAFMGAGVNIFGQLSQETGDSQSALRTLFLRSGGSIGAPANFLSDLGSSTNATTGLSQYAKTWGGELEDVKKSVGSVLAMFEAPLGSALAGASTKIETWASGTETRFGQLSGTLSKDWSSDNMSGFGATLAKVLGDPHLAGIITGLASSVHGFGQVVEHDLIPAGKDILTVAGPALKMLGDTLDFLGQHKTTFDALLITFIGWEALSKVATSVQAASRAFTALSKSMDEVGASQTALNTLKGALGMKPSEKASAAETVAKDAEKAGKNPGDDLAIGWLASKLGPLALGDLALPVTGALGSGALGIMMLKQTEKTDPWTQAKQNSINNVMGPGGQGLNLQQLANLGNVTVNVQPGAVQVTGAGDPQKVGNQVAKGINDQIVQQQKIASRRVAGTGFSFGTQSS